MIARNAEMHVLTSHLVAHARSATHSKTQEYESRGSERAFWLLVDLRGSAAYRQFAGTRNAFIRGEVFIDLVRVLADCYEHLEVMKELGDGILIKSRSFREVIEVCCLLHAVNRAWAGFDSRDEAPSLEYGAYLTYGDCLKLNRKATIDYVGVPLDELARVSSYKGQPSNTILVGSFAAFQDLGGILDELPFLEFSTPHLLDSTLQKKGEKRIRLVTATIDTGAFDGFDRYFVRVRDAFTPTNDVTEL